MAEFEIALPIPPSTNNLYRNAGRAGRVKSVEYARWLAYAAATLSPRPAPLPAQQPYALRIEAGLSRRRDLGNIEKPITDLLVSLGLVPDDRWCDRIVLTRTAEAANFCRVTARRL